MDNRAKITDALNNLLTCNRDDAFVIIEALPSKKFVQFAGSQREELCLDLPAQTLSETEFYRAVKLFQDIGVSGTEYPLLDQPGGQVVGHQFSFNKIFYSVTEATEIVEKIFSVVYLFPTDGDLNIIEE